MNKRLISGRDERDERDASDRSWVFKPAPSAPAKDRSSGDEEGYSATERDVGVDVGAHQR